MEEPKDFKVLTHCRACAHGFLTKILTLGDQKIVDFTTSPGTSTKPSVPLTLVKCDNCHLVQLSCSVNPSLMYSEFWYRSGINESMRKALEDIVSQGIDRTNLQADDVVLDIGANDGTLLGMYPKNVITCGIDPCNQITTPEAMSKMSYAIRSFFNGSIAQELLNKTKKRFKIITAIAMFYDIENPIEFLRTAKSVLDDDGILIIQMNYLVSMLNRNCFDNICHEHLTYYSFTSLEWLLSKVGFTVVDAEVNEVNGGSIRVYLKKSPVRRDDFSEEAVKRVHAILDTEEEMKLHTLEPYRAFTKRVKKILEGLSIYFVQQTLNGKKCFAYGASTRGTVLLQATSIPLIGVAERDQNKIGRHMVTSQPTKSLLIVTEEVARKEADIMLVLPWHFKDSIVAREKEWLEQGGILIFPLPVPTVVTKDSEYVMESEPLFSSRGKLDNPNIHTVGANIEAN